MSDKLTFLSDAERFKKLQRDVDKWKSLAGELESVLLQIQPLSDDPRYGSSEIMLLCVDALAKARAVFDDSKQREAGL